MHASARYTGLTIESCIPIVVGQILRYDVAGVKLPSHRIALLGHVRDSAGEATDHDSRPQNACRKSGVRLSR